MKLKGHAEIELRDASGKVTDRFSEDNLVTNFWPSYAKPLGNANRGIYVNGIDPAEPFKSLFGGILLLGSTLEEDADNFQAPLTVEMVGNGAHDTVSNDQVTELGSFNAAESGFNAEGTSYTFVYDFTTSQANGYIRAIALTNPVLGYIGMGNRHSGQRKTTRRKITAMAGDMPQGNIGIAAGDPTSYFAIQPAWFDVPNNQVAQFSAGFMNMIAAGHITGTVYNFPFGVLRPFDSASIPSEGIPEPVSTFDHPVAARNITGVVYGMQSDETVIAYKVTVASPGTTSIHLIRLKADGTCTELDITAGDEWQRRTLKAVGIAGGYLYIGTDDGFHCWELADLSNYVLLPGNPAQSFSVIGNAFVCSDSVLIGQNAYPTNAVQIDQTAFQNPVSGVSRNDESVLIYVDGYNNVAKPARSPFWISTINNLSSAVQKTASKTMKIVYTLTEVAE